MGVLKGVVHKHKGTKREVSRCIQGGVWGTRSEGPGNTGGAEQIIQVHVLGRLAA